MQERLNGPQPRVGGVDTSAESRVPQSEKRRGGFGIYGSTYGHLAEKIAWRRIASYLAHHLDSRLSVAPSDGVRTQLLLVVTAFFAAMALVAPLVARLGATGAARRRETRRLVRPRRTMPSARPSANGPPIPAAIRPILAAEPAPESFVDNSGAIGSGALFRKASDSAAVAAWATRLPPMCG